MWIARAMVDVCATRPGVPASGTVCGFCRTQLSMAVPALFDLVTRLPASSAHLTPLHPIFMLVRRLHSCSMLTHPKKSGVRRDSTIHTRDSRSSQPAN